MFVILVSLFAPNRVVPIFFPMYLVAAVVVITFFVFYTTIYGPGYGALIAP